jgi:hypothetical protein
MHCPDTLSLWAIMRTEVLGYEASLWLGVRQPSKV